MSIANENNSNVVSGEAIIKVQRIFADSAKKKNSIVVKELKFKTHRCYGNYSAERMSSRKKERTASKLDHKQEVYHPLDYSFKTLNVFEGKMNIELVLYKHI